MLFSHKLTEQMFEFNLSVLFKFQNDQTQHLLLLLTWSTLISFHFYPLTQLCCQYIIIHTLWSQLSSLIGIPVLIHSCSICSDDTISVIAPIHLLVWRGCTFFSNLGIFWAFLTIPTFITVKICFHMSFICVLTPNDYNLSETGIISISKLRTLNKGQ